MPTPRVSTLLAVALMLVGCAPEGVEDPTPEDEVQVTDDELNEPGFDRNRVLGDAAFTDADAMSAEQIQAFLENTPYGGRSVLATTTASDGTRASRAIWEAAQEHRINPIVILVRAQMEQSLVAKSTASARALNHAFGCGCPDYESCSPQYKGFGKQVACMTELMRGYLDDLDGGGSTIAGWKVGKAKKTLDPLWVTPSNKATAALYTYTPWVGSSGFGNVSHFRLWKKFAGFVGYFPAGPGGCTAERYPSGLIAQLLPSPDLTEAYAAAPGGDASSAPTCFLDRRQLEDPLSGAVAPSSSKIAPNFSVDEMFAGEPSTTRNAVIDPTFVERLQALRSRLAKSVTVVDAYRTPERHQRTCEETCGASSCADLSCAADVADAPLVHGKAAFLTASSSESALLAAAQHVGFTGCAIEGGDLYVELDGVSRGCPAE
jgi:hypothetical protein